MILYKTVDKEASAEQLIEKSRFIAHVAPASTKEEADAFIARIREQHKGATHNVPAMVLGDQFQIQWASDDGEPQGTSGAPMVQMLVAQGISNVVVVVTRYFGGIKLGPGGLVRAYTSSARLGIEAAGVVPVEEREKIQAIFDYSYLSRFQNLSISEEYELENITYQESVQAVFSTAPERGDRVEDLIRDVTKGTAKILSRKIMQTR